ncbi:hypothetical protein SAMN05519103_08497 [Rhizobiales bacterium GAS113]|nr:hypothetical protein SAMN05519103_08497 [Rhizobiales bacterium GAS113]
MFPGIAGTRPALEAGLAFLGVKNSSNRCAGLCGLPETLNGSADSRQTDVRDHIAGVRLEGIAFGSGILGPAPRRSNLWRSLLATDIGASWSAVFGSWLWDKSNFASV